MPSTDPPLSSTPPQHSAPRLSSAASRRSHRKTVSADFVQRFDSSDEEELRSSSRPALFSPRKGSVGTDSIQRELRNAGWSIAPDDAKAAALNRSRSHRHHNSIASHRSRHLSYEQEDVLRTALEAVSIAQAALVSARDALEDALGDTLGLGASANMTRTISSSGSNIAPALASSEKSKRDSKLPLMSQRHSLLSHHSDISESEASYDSGPAGRALLADAQLEADMESSQAHWVQFKQPPPSSTDDPTSANLPAFPYDLDEASKILTQASAPSTRGSSTLVTSPPAAPCNESHSPVSDSPRSNLAQLVETTEACFETRNEHASPFGMPTQLWPRPTTPASQASPSQLVLTRLASPTQTIAGEVEGDNSEVKEHESGDPPLSFGSLSEHFSHVRGAGVIVEEEPLRHWPKYEQEEKVMEMQDEQDESMEVLGEWLEHERYDGQIQPGILDPHLHIPHQLSLIEELDEPSSMSKSRSDLLANSFGVRPASADHSRATLEVEEEHHTVDQYSPSSIVRLYNRSSWSTSTSELVLASRTAHAQAHEAPPVPRLPNVSPFSPPMTPEKEQAFLPPLFTPDSTIVLAELIGQGLTRDISDARRDGPPTPEGGDVTLPPFKPSTRTTSAGSYELRQCFSAPMLAPREYDERSSLTQGQTTTENREATKDLQTATQSQEQEEGIASASTSTVKSEFTPQTQLCSHWSSAASSFTTSDAYGKREETPTLLHDLKRSPPPFNNLDSDAESYEEPQEGLRSPSEARQHERVPNRSVSRATMNSVHSKQGSCSSGIRISCQSSREVSISCETGSELLERRPSYSSLSQHSHSPELARVSLPGESAPVDSRLTHSPGNLSLSSSRSSPALRQAAQEPLPQHPLMHQRSTTFLEPRDAPTPPSFAVTSRAPKPQTIVTPSLPPPPASAPATISASRSAKRISTGAAAIVRVLARERKDSKGEKENKEKEARSAFVAKSSRADRPLLALPMRGSLPRPSKVTPPPLPNVTSSSSSSGSWFSRFSSKNTQSTAASAAPLRTPRKVSSDEHVGEATQRLGTSSSEQAIPRSASHSDRMLPPSPSHRLGWARLTQKTRNGSSDSVKVRSPTNARQADEAKQHYSLRSIDLSRANSGGKASRPQLERTESSTTSKQQQQQLDEPTLSGSPFSRDYVRVVSPDDSGAEALNELNADRRQIKSFTKLATSGSRTLSERSPRGMSKARQLANDRGLILHLTAASPTTDILGSENHLGLALHQQLESERKVLSVHESGAEDIKSTLVAVELGVAT